MKMLPALLLVCLMPLHSMAHDSPSAPGAGPSSAGVRLLGQFALGVADSIHDGQTSRTAANGRIGKARAAAAESSEFAGEWRVFLPAGYEHQMTIVDQGEQRYSLQPASLNFGGTYRRQGDLLVSQPIDDDDTPGKYVWKIRSGHMLTLVEQTAQVGSDYTGAVLFRPRENVLDGE